MNMNSIIRMLSKMFMRRGINAGIDYASRRGKKREQMSDMERQNAQNARQTASKAQKGLRLVRRLMRMR